MKWSKPAEEAMLRVPFFVRKRVRKRVEEEAARNHGSEVTLKDVEACKQRFLKKMEDEVKGYQLESCFGASGCPNRAVIEDAFTQKVGHLFESKNIKDFLKKSVNGPLKLHHEFRVSISDCPNACSRPQIADLGLIGAVRPVCSTDKCTQCEACAQGCREQAVSMHPSGKGVRLDSAACVSCGQCVKLCTTGALKPYEVGYRIQVGGKLGRHPQLAKELPGVFTPSEALSIVNKCVDHYMRCCRSGERFGEILHRTGLDTLI